MAGALFGLETRIYMGARDVERQQLNVFRMRLMGAEVVPVTAAAGLKDAINEALRDWTASFADTHYLLGTVAGPHPFPLMVREFQRVIGKRGAGADPGGGGAAARRGDRLRRRRLQRDRPVRRLPRRRRRAADRRRGGRQGARRRRAWRDPAARPARACCTAPRPMCCRTRTGRSARAGRSRPGLDYPAVGPGARLPQGQRPGRLCRRDRRGGARRPSPCWRGREGIVCAFESAHALAHALKIGRRGTRLLLVNLSGRGDKDMAQAQRLLGLAMSRYDAHVRAQGEGVFGAFVMLGDPDLETSAAILDAAGRGRRRHDRGRHPLFRSDRRRAGDPGGGGAGARRRACGRPIASLCSAAFARAIRTSRSASSLMPISSSRAAGTPSTAPRAEAGADSVLVADVPLMEAAPFVAAARAWGIAPVLIAAANTPPDRLRRIAAARRRLHLLRRPARRDRRRRDGALRPSTRCSTSCAPPARRRRSSASASRGPTMSAPRSTRARRA